MILRDLRILINKMEHNSKIVQIMFRKNLERFIKVLNFVFFDFILRK